MESNHKYLYKDFLQEYYRCFENIDNSYQLLENTRNASSWYAEKLEEGRQLLNSFGLSNQDINNSPEFKFTEQTANLAQVNNFLKRIVVTIETKDNDDKFIEETRKNISSLEHSTSNASSNIQRLDKQRPKETIWMIILGALSLFFGLLIISFVVDLFSGVNFFVFIGGIIFLAIFLAIFIPSFNGFRKRLNELQSITDQRNSLELDISENNAKINQLSREIEEKKGLYSSHYKPLMLELLFKINEHTKLAYQAKEKQEKLFERTWNEETSIIREIMAEIESSKSADIPPRLLTLNWDDPLWSPSESESNHWQPQISGLAPDIVRIGEFELEYEDKFTKFPALLPIRDFSQELPNYTSGHIALFSEDTNSRQEALLALQSVAFRIISSFPMRKLKGIFIDPVSVGDTFPFRDLHNFITSQKTYTRTDDIREQLRGLTEHIEQVTQNYLSKNYATIEDYNADAEGVAEPYRYLFITDFPTGFDQRSLEDLKSILLNGPKAGVYIVIHVDQTLNKPKQFEYFNFNDFCTTIQFGQDFEIPLREGNVYLGYIHELTDDGVFVQIRTNTFGFVPYNSLKVFQEKSGNLYLIQHEFHEEYRAGQFVRTPSVKIGDKTIVKVESIRDNFIKLNSQNIPEGEAKKAYGNKGFRSLSNKDNLSFKLKLPTSSNNLIVNLKLDQPPSNELFNQMSEAINQAIRDVKIDTIAFSKLYPENDWHADSRKELRASIGLMGAKDKLEFWLGENQDGEIASNGLLAGKPGSGKSFTLHAIITNLAMQYSPDELELYLLDFKQGVEFQIYVDPEKGENRSSSTDFDETKALPHAKVISIESDREFGLSVLEYVNQQIENRSKLFKSIGNFEKINEYRNITENKLPRILVLIDEFQYMFQESDAVTQRLNVVMENIVRQGRAFGIHLLIASQSPSVSNMNRRIYDFIDLRMALQMPQNVVSSVLAEGNTDAIDLLDRPGKLIYNRNFGNKNYNDIGQVADISAEERNKALIHIQNVAKQQQYQRSEPLVLFYGSKPTQLQDNRQLLQLMRMDKWLSLRELNKQVIKEPDWIVQESPSVFWLGEPMRIGNHTKGIFRRRPRSNLLLVGNSEETIFGIISGILISLIHCSQPKKAKFNIIDLSIEDEDNPWTEMTFNFRSNFDTFFPIKIAKRYGDSEAEVMKAETLLKETFEEFERRLKLRDENPELNPNELGESLFFIYAIGGINRAQNLRPVMGRRDEEPSEDAQKILQLISQGSELGIHTILWLEDMKAFAKLSTNNRQWLGNFDLRVALTMPGEDSRLLLGENVAEKLPRLRGYFKDESVTVGLDKFKPYAVSNKAEMLEYATNFNKRS